MGDVWGIVNGNFIIWDVVNDTGGSHPNFTGVIVHDEDSIDLDALYEARYTLLPLDLPNPYPGIWDPRDYHIIFQCHLDHDYLFVDCIDILDFVTDVLLDRNVVPRLSSIPPMTCYVLMRAIERVMMEIAVCSSCTNLYAYYVRRALFPKLCLMQYYHEQGYL